MPSIRGMRATKMFRRALPLAALVCFLIPVSIASAAQHCVGDHPLCVSPNTYPATNQGLINAMNAANGAGFPGADEILIGAGDYSLSAEPILLNISDDLKVIGEGPRTRLIVATDGIAGMWLGNGDYHDVELGHVKVVSEGFGSGRALQVSNTYVHDVALEVVATSGGVLGIQLVGDSEFADSTITLTGTAAQAGYGTGNPVIRDVTVESTDGTSSGFAFSSTGGVFTLEGVTMRRIRRGAVADQGKLIVRDSFFDLGSSNSAIGVGAVNDNNSNSEIELDADNVTVVGTGSNQAGAAVSGTATTDAFTETGTGHVANSLFHLTGTNALALRCAQSGLNTSATMSSLYVAAPAAKISRSGTCAGSDDEFIDTTSTPPQFNFPAVGDYRPVPGSPVVDAGDPDYVLEPGVHDVEGLDRVVDGDGSGTARVDIGAHELQSAMKPSPIEISVSPNPADVGELIDLSATSHEPDGGTVDFDWDFGDGNSDSGNDLQHSYSEPGDYTITVTATDDELEQSVSTKDIHISSDPPTTPTVDVDKQYTFRHEPVVFTAHGSTDLSGDPVAYEWTFSGGGTATSSENEGVTRLPTNLEGDGSTTYQASVRAVGKYGEKSEAATASVTVYNHLPTVTQINVDQPARYRGEDFTFSADATDAPEDDVIMKSWNFGDGTPATSYSNVWEVTHSYETVGDKTVTVTVRDGYFLQNGPDEVEDSLSTTVTVLNRDPVVGEIAHSGNPVSGETQTFSVEASELEDDPLAYAWDFGDGATAAGASVSHVYLKGGSYNVTVVVSDGQGGAVVKQLPLAIAQKQARIEMAKPAKNFKRVSLTASDPVVVSFRLLKVKAGFKKGSRCVKMGRGKRCDLPVKGSVKQTLAAGRTVVNFRGKWKRKKLAKGRYKLVATPADGGPAVTTSFRIR